MKIPLYNWNHIFMLKFDKKITSKENTDQYYKAEKLWLSHTFKQGLCIRLQTWDFRRSLEIVVKNTWSSRAQKKH
jgi:hypothetical protein